MGRPSVERASFSLDLLYLRYQADLLLTTFEETCLAKSSERNYDYFVLKWSKKRLVVIQDPSPRWLSLVLAQLV